MEVRFLLGYHDLYGMVQDLVLGPPSSGHPAWDHQGHPRKDHPPGEGVGDPGGVDPLAHRGPQGLHGDLLGKKGRQY